MITGKGVRDDRDGLNDQNSLLTFQLIFRQGENLALVRFGFSRVPHKSSLLLIASAVVVYLNNSRTRTGGASHSPPSRPKHDLLAAFSLRFPWEPGILSSLPMPVLPWIVLIKYSGFDFRRRLRISRAIYRCGCTHRGVKVRERSVTPVGDLSRSARRSGNWLLGVTRGILR